MSIEITDLQGHFKGKADGDLLYLASTASGMSPEARIVLLQELQMRFDAAKDRPRTIQLVHAWYTVYVQRPDIKFPDRCPNCLREGATAVSRSTPTPRRDTE